MSASLPPSSSFAAFAFDRVTAPILQLFSEDQARRVVQFQADETLLNRIDELADKSNEGELTADEKAEDEGYVRANKFVAILQAQARKRLTTGDAS
jgi:hypothetical protein